jgi:hypothetical protein
MPLFDSACLRHNWIAVASAAHARLGCATPQRGFMQVCHGKCAPLKRVQPGDRVVYYAPTVTLGGKDRLQSFVSIGVVLPGVPYAFDMGGGFVPFRRCSMRLNLSKTGRIGATNSGLACFRLAMPICA